MFGNEQNEVEKYLIKEGYEDFKFLRKNGGSYFYEVVTFWSGKHIIKVSNGFFGWKKEKL
ncbi:hypothetical protein DWB98_13355 (plasmid) [Staphylococcus xylosus]|uniref:hypothetical protein n=1 Tax=Staphylococcus xylosus TaxID=1288 RepID=UPI00118D55C7|nr:hypothetical protein [Staphylococcus xylosus]MBM6639478.1 hypothetical protein [Staphylococcus xylosus]QDW90429.1 hypothetical protein DWB98_13355 [Staphylococcus xylosus]